MKPDNNSQSGGVSAPNTHQTSAADVIRLRIDSLFEHQNDSPQTQNAPVATTVASQVQQEAQQASPYTRTHNTHPQPQAEQWKEYHTAWQNYYQQYYAQYYTAQQTPTATENPSGHYFSHQPEEEPIAADEALSKDTALLELRNQLLSKVQESAQTVRKSRHFVPITAALIVVLIFVFVQYNRVFIAGVSAYVSPGAISPQNIVIDPRGDTVVTADSRLIIPKINVDVPAIYDVGNDYTSQMATMEKGVAHFAIPGASSHPGEIGNTVLSGHSSNDLFDRGDYKFIFAQLEKLTVGDTLYANYNSVRYTYVVTKTEVVKPTEVNKLVYPASKPVMTLITCTPLGTSEKRLLVTAEQVSPDPSAAKAASTTGQSEATADIPGSAPTFLERLFGKK